MMISKVVVAMMIFMVEKETITSMEATVMMI